MNKFVAKMRELKNAVKDRYDPWSVENTIRSSCPSVNWMFGKTHAIPLGYTILSWGEQKAGKSVLGYDLAGQTHKKWDDAIVIKFDTEFRDIGQLDEEHAQAYGIDLDRWMVFQTNQPVDLFDTINKEIAALIDDGANIKMIIIDSISNLMGRKTAEQESLAQFQIGDHAQTLQIGFQSIRQMLFKNRILLYLTAHARDEMDRIEVMRGNKKKPAAANAVKHLCEFIVNVERNNTKDGYKDELDNQLVDESKKDMSDDSERTGHKIRFWMQGNTIGPANRVAEATFDYNKGFINQHEEIFRLGKNWGVFQRISAQIWKIGSEEFRGKPAVLEALKTRTDLQQFVLKSLQEREKTVGNVIVSDAQAQAEFDNIDNTND
jgi:RecA/RadA recombinase